MGLGFVAMQIGDTQLDDVFEQAIAPAITACGLQPRRVDRHNEGGLLKSEIIKFLETSELIVADITNERPNVYLEIGYAMGLDKFRQLVLCVREDHFPDSPRYVRGGPRIHFDLAGYDILRWDPENLPAFRNELELRIRRRRALTPAAIASATIPSAIDEEWVARQRETARAAMSEHGVKGHMEIVAALRPPKPSKSRQDLSEAAAQAPIHTFGWPIAVYMHNNDLHRPRPRADGISAEIATEESYDAWSLRQNTDFYFVGSLFEDQRSEGALFFDTRTNRVTEALMYLIRLHGLLGTLREQELVVRVTHNGIRGRRLVAAGQNRHLIPRGLSVEDESSSTIEASLDALEAELPAFVRAIVNPLFELFDFTHFEATVIDEIVNNFVEGRVR